MHAGRVSEQEEMPHGRTQQIQILRTSANDGRAWAPLALASSLFSTTAGIWTPSQSSALFFLPLDSIVQLPSGQVHACMYLWTMVYGHGQLAC
jgi:hypothetical protein